MKNKIDDFFFAGNAVSSELDYGLAETFVRSILDNPLGQINAKYVASGVVEGDIKFANASVVDLMETDYH